jgi:uncharacterized protein (DUF924 family)
LALLLALEQFSRSLWRDTPAALLPALLAKVSFMVSLMNSTIAAVNVKVMK